MNYLLCWLRGHLPKRLNGTFFVVCRRCDATLNLRVSTSRAA